MKSTAQFLFLLFFSYFINVNAQILPNFDFSPKENWKVFAKDPYYNGSVSDTTNDGYRRRLLIDQEFYQEYFYTLEVFISYLGSNGLDGYLINKIDPKDGKVLWTSIHNRNSDTLNQHRENYQTANLYFEGDSLVIFGFRNRKDYNSSQVQYYFHGDIIKRKISLQTGNSRIVGLGNDNQESPLSVNLDGSFILYNSKGQMGQINSGSYIMQDSTLIDTIGITLIDPLTYNRSNLHFSLENNTQYNKSDVPFGPGVLSLLRQRDTLTSVFLNKDSEYLEHSPASVVFKKYIVSELNNISLIDSSYLSKNFLGTFNFPNDLISGYPFISLTDGSYYFAIYYTDKNNYNYTNNFWLDAEGKLLASAERASLDGKIYGNLIPIGVLNEKLYLASRHNNSITKKVDCDIVVLEKGANKLKFLTSIDLANQEQSLKINSGKIYKDDILLSFYLSNGQAFNNYTGYVSFPLKDLGITTELNENLNHNVFELYPNPIENNLINIYAAENFTGKAYVYNELGVIVANFALKETKHIPIFIKEKGIHIVQLFDEDGKSVYIRKIYN